METVRKKSRKREAMLAALRATTEHPTAEMLYNTLKPEYPELSLGTVYRNLSVLAEEGLVVSVAHVNGQERYDARVEPHTHFHLPPLRPGHRPARASGRDRRYVRRDRAPLRLPAGEPHADGQRYVPQLPRRG